MPPSAYYPCVACVLPVCCLCVACVLPVCCLCASSMPTPCTHSAFRIKYYIYQTFETYRTISRRMRSLSLLIAFSLTSRRALWLRAPCGKARAVVMQRYGNKAPARLATRACWRVYVDAAWRRAHACRLYSWSGGRKAAAAARHGDTHVLRAHAAGRVAAKEAPRGCQRSGQRRRRRALPQAAPLD